MVATIVMALRVFGLSAEAGWTCMVSLFLLFSGVVYLRYRSGKWRSIRVLESEPVVVPNPGFHEPIDL
jgi:MATE family multidrug resistance protein